MNTQGPAARARGLIRPVLRFDAPVEPRWAAHAAFASLALYLIALPTFGTAALRSIALGMLLIATLWAIARRQLVARLPLAALWLPYAGVAIVSLAYAIDPLYSLDEIKTDIAVVLLAMCAAATWTTTDADRQRIFAAASLGFAAVVCTGVFVSLKAGAAFRGLEPTGPLHLFVGESSTYVVLFLPYLGALALLSRRTALRVLLALVSGAALYLLYRTGNRIGPFAVAAAVLVFGLTLARRAPRRARVTVLAGAAAALLAAGGVGALMLQQRTLAKETTGQSIRSDPRLTLWEVATANLAERPWSGGGYGIRAFSLRNPKVAAANTNYWHAHNPFLNRGVQMGWPGIAAFALLLAMTAAALVGAWRRAGSEADRVFAAAALASTVAMIIKSLTDDFMVGQFGSLYWVLIACVLAPIVHKRDRSAQAPPRAVSADRGATS